MNLYARTFSVLKAHVGKLVIASSSAALHAVFSGALVWMFGPLLMTLFQVGAIGGIDPTSMTGGAETTVTEQASTAADQSWLVDLQNGLVSIRETMKGWVNNVVEAETRTDTLLRFVWLILAVAVFKNVFYYIQGYFMAFIQQSVIRYFRDRLFEKYQRLSLDYFHRRRTGQLISRVTNDVLVLNESIDIGFNRLVVDSLTVMLFSTFLIVLSWKLTLLAMIVLPAVFGFIWFVAKKLRKYSERTQERMEDVNSVLEEAVSNVRVVKAFSMEQFESNKFFKTTREYFDSLLRMTRIRHLAKPINDMLATLAGVIILWFAGSRIIQGTGELGPGDFMTYLLAMFSLINPAKSLSQIHIKLQEGMAAAERIFSVLDAEERVSDRPNAQEKTDFKEVIKYENVTFGYTSFENVLKGVSFDVNHGEVVAVVGASGSGKSTMLDLLPRFYDPQEGRISIDGVDIRDIKLASLRGMMGIVTQETQLFNDSVRNNIAYGLNGVPDDEIIRVAEMANAHQFIREFEDGYDTFVGNRGVRLSGGQRQRIAIARALLRNPQILIFDEATSALDTEAEALVQEAIDRLMKGRTVLVIAHRLSTIKHADRIFVMERGKIIECGTHEQLLSRGGTYNRLYNMQFRDYQ